MKKAASKSSGPVSLGTKRSCPNPKCGTKFYDFNKPEIFCPKCETEVDPTKAEVPLKLAPEAKKTIKTGDKIVDPILASEDAAPFEAADDLAGDEEVVDDLEVDDDDEDEDY